MIVRFLILIGLLLFVEVYSYQAFRTVIKTKWILNGYLILSLSVIVCITYNVLQFDFKVGQTPKSLYTLGLLLLVLLPKIVITVVMFGEDISRVLLGAIRHLFVERENKTDFLASRRKFVSQVGLGLAAIPFLSLIYGMTIGKYNFKVIKQNVFFLIYLMLSMVLRLLKFQIFIVEVLIIPKRSITRWI